MQFAEHFCTFWSLDILIENFLFFARRKACGVKTPHQKHQISNVELAGMKKTDSQIENEKQQAMVKKIIIVGEGAFNFLLLVRA